MNRKKRIQTKLSNHFKDLEIEVEDNSLDHKGHHSFDGNQESHFKISLKNKFEIKLNRMLIHRKINELLDEEFQKGMHALEIKII